MEITNIVAHKIKPKGTGICGEFSVVFDDMLCVHHIKVIGGYKGLFIAFPNNGEREVTEDGKKRYIDVIHPMNNDFRTYIKQKILDKYEEELDKLKSEE